MDAGPTFFIDADIRGTDARPIALERVMKATRWMVAAGIVVALVGARYALGGDSSSSAQAAPAAPQVTVAKVIVRPLAQAQTYTGRLQAVDAVQVRPRVGGYVTAVDFTEGAMVHKGQLLFRIDPRPYQAEVNRLAAELTNARSELKLAKANDARAEQLVAKNYIAKQDRDRLDAAVRGADAKTAATAASLQAARLNLDFTEVRAPIDGRVSNVRITPGNLVTSADVLTEVVSVDPLYAYFDVDEHSYLQLLGSGDANARGDATANRASVLMGLADEDGFPHRGRIDFIDNRLDAGAGTIRLRAVFDNEGGTLVPGLFARLRLESGPARPTVLIDDRAIGTDLGNRFVYVVDAAGKAQYRRVETGQSFHGLRIVTHGLKTGDTIIVNGLQRVQPGSAVTAKTVAMDTRLSATDRAVVRNDSPLGRAGDNAIARK
jgi:RND family efflux transporter MFP subunit